MSLAVVRKSTPPVAPTLGPVVNTCVSLTASLKTESSPFESSLVPVTKTFDPSGLTASAQGSSLWLPGPSKAHRPELSAGRAVVRDGREVVGGLRVVAVARHEDDGGAVERVQADADRVRAVLAVSGPVVTLSPQPPAVGGAVGD